MADGPLCPGFLPRNETESRGFPRPRRSWQSRIVTRLGKGPFDTFAVEPQEGGHVARFQGHRRLESATLLNPAAAQHRVVVANLEACAGAEAMGDSRDRQTDPPASGLDVVEFAEAIVGKDLHRIQSGIRFDPLRPVVAADEAVGAVVPQHAEEGLLAILPGRSAPRRPHNRRG